MPFSWGEKDFSAVDVNILRELSKLKQDDNFLSSLIDNYFHDTRKLLDALVPAARENRLDEIRDLLHAMKGTALYMGASALAEYATDVRSQLHTLSPEHLMQAVIKIHSIFTITETELLAFVTSDN